MRSARPVLYARLALLTATLAWGSTFLVTKHTLDSIDTYYLLAIRFSGASLFLGILFHRTMKYTNRTVLGYGLLLGLFLFTAYVLQTEGIKQSTPGKAAFLSAVYCMIVPFLAWYLFRRKPTPFHLASALLCLGGIALVAHNGNLSLQIGDLLLLGGSFFFAVHIVTVAKATHSLPILPLTVTQFAVAAVLAWTYALLFNRPPTAFTPAVNLCLTYLCLVATALAFLCQNTAQRYLSPASASLLLSLEAVFGVAFSVIFAGEKPTVGMCLGFALIFLSVLVAEVLPAISSEKRYLGQITEKRKNPASNRK